MNLTAKQRAFCQEYLVDLNATQAAIRAGYSPRTARQVGAENLSKPDIQAELTKLMEERAQRVEIDADTVLRELLRLARVDLSAAFNDNGSLKPVRDMPEDVRRAISGVDVFEEFQGRGEDRAMIGYTKKLRFWDKTKALELLGRHLKLFSDKIELTGKDGGPVEFGGNPRPMPEEVCEFSREAHQAFAAYRDEKGEAATMGAREITAIAEAVAAFASGTDHGQATASQVGEVIARVHCIRRGILAGMADREAPPQS